MEYMTNLEQRQEAVIYAADLVKKYGDFEAVKGVNLLFKEGTLGRASRIIKNIAYVNICYFIKNCETRGMSHLVSG